MKRKNELVSIQPYLADIRPDFEPLIQSIHQQLSQLDCTVGIKEAKSGHVVSYQHPESGKAVANLISRKTGPHIRIYGDHSPHYLPLLEALPESLLGRIAKASDCRRLLDPTKCNARCPTGYDLTLHGQRYQKCRYACLLFPVTAQDLPHIQGILAEEVRARSS